MLRSNYLRRFLKTTASVQKANALKLTNYKFHKLDESSIPETTSLKKEDAKKYFHDMTMIRTFEQEFSRLYKERAIRGFCHLYSGQEACSVGMEAALIEGDAIITAYRSHGWTYTRGCPVRSIAAELFGYETGCSKGRGGSMHTYAKNFYGGNGIVGAQVPLGTGIAFSNKYNNNGNVCVTAYGDGAANQGQVFESFNIAALWKLPVIYVCENNEYAMGTSVERSAYSGDFYTRGDYIPGIKVNANCVLSVREATRFATEYCRSGKGPIILELHTYRYFGHSMSDPGTSYRTKDEVKDMRTSNDPIRLFRNVITDANLFTNEELDAVTDGITEYVEGEIEKALKDPLPSVDHIAHHIHSNVLESDKTTRGCSQYSSFPNQ